MSRAPQRVQVFALGLPRADVAKDKRRYRVKWRVDGRDRTRAYRIRAEADRYRAVLLSAVRDGEGFDPETGEPASWRPADDGPTWWSWSREWLVLKWTQWSGHSRRSAVETLTLLAPELVRPDAPEPPTDVASWLRTTGYQPTATPDGPCAAWLARWSLPLAEIDPEVIEPALRAICGKADGTAAATSVARRRRGLFGAVLRAAVRRELLASNPMDRVEWRAPKPNLTIDVSTVPSPDDVEAIVDLVEGMTIGAARYSALFAAIGMAGLRPSEAAALRLADLDLPTTGWGLACLRGAVTSPGTRYTGDGGVLEAKGLKHRPEGAVREVPLPPDLVRRLREHLAHYEPVCGQVFTNARGRAPNSTNYGPVWTRARSRLWPVGHLLADATAYDLRHAAATMMLRAGVPPAEVALRLGHSVDVLMRVYAGVFADDRDRSNELIDQALAAKRAGTS